MTTDLVDRQQLMDSRTPAHLFGDAAHDPRSLRRAYARLAKVYRPDDDPEAFQHLRGLFEAAKEAHRRGEAPAAVEAGTTPAPRQEPDPTGPPEAARRRPPTWNKQDPAHATPKPAHDPLIDRLIAAQQSDDWHTQLRLLHLHALRLMEERPRPTAWMAVRIARHLAHHLEPVDLELLQMLLVHPRFDDAGQGEHLEHALRRASWLKAAAADPRVPDALPTELLALQEGGLPERARTLARIRDIPGDLTALLDHLEWNHPDLLSWITQACREIEEVLEGDVPALSVDDHKALRIFARPLHLPLGRNQRVLRHVFEWGTGLMCGVTVAAMGRLRSVVGTTLIVRWILHGMVNIYLKGRARGRTTSPVWSDAPRVLAQAARRLGTTPSCLARQLAPEPLDGWTPDDPLVAFQQDPASFLRCLDTPLYDRLDAQLLERP